MAYQTFSLLLADADFSFRCEVVAIDLASAMADVTAAHGDVRLVQWSCK